MIDAPDRRPGRRPSISELARFVEAAVALTMAWVAIRLLPFRIVMKSTEFGRASADPSAMSLDAAGHDVRQAIKRAAKRLPWSIVCFPEALAAHWMLRRRGAASTLHYGLRTSPEKLSAHVWVTLAGETIVGEERDHPHNCVAIFPRASSA